MCAGARPGVLAGIGHHARPHRIPLDIAHGRPQMRLIHHRGIEAVLPEVPRRVPAGIRAMGIAAVRLSQTARQGILAFRHHDQVHVVGHQAVADQPEARWFAILRDQAEIGDPIAVAAKHVLPVVAALRDVMRQPDSHHPRQSGHDIWWPALTVRLRKVVNT